jgi:hypothetical protein
MFKAGSISATLLSLPAALVYFAILSFIISIVGDLKFNENPP